MKKESSFSYDSKFNICIVGSSKIGKTSYIKRILDDQFNISYNKTCGINTHLVTKEMNKASYLFKFWDLSGETKSHDLSSELYRTIDCFVFAFAIDDENSFKVVKQWLDYTISKRVSLDHSLFVCFKSDLEETNSAVDLSQVNKISQDYEIEFMKVSSKDNVNVKESFNNIANKMVIRLGNSLNTSLTSGEDGMSKSGCLIF